MKFVMVLWSRFYVFPGDVVVVRAGIVGVVLWYLSAGLTGAAATQAFSDWTLALRSEALEKGISAQTFDDAFKDVELIERVVELDRSQPEFTLTLEGYLERVISQTRITKARQRLAQHKDILAEISKQYNVQPRFIVALWGIETNFGQNMGGFDVIEALATLAYDGRRARFFRKELLNALLIIEHGHIASSDMKGSWAGAMGQSQFMPSSFLAYAEDFNQDGRRDIWTTKEDVFASIANYLSRSGWRGDITWGREVKVPKDMDSSSLNKNKTIKTMEDWRALGVTRKDGSPLPKRNLKSRLVIPKHGEGRAFLAYDNYDTLLKWNRSNYFAVAVGTLADKLLTSN